MALRVHPDREEPPRLPPRNRPPSCSARRPATPNWTGPPPAHRLRHLRLRQLRAPQRQVLRLPPRLRARARRAHAEELLLPPPPDPGNDSGGFLNEPDSWLTRVGDGCCGLFGHGAGHSAGGSAPPSERQGT